MLDFLDVLKSADVYRDEDLAGVRTIDPLPAVFAESVPSGLCPEVQAALAALGIERLYEHQARAIDHILSREDVALVSPTASGKTLCFNLPIVSELYTNRDLYALYVYPMKALANDQLLALKDLTKHLPTPHCVSAWTFDGDTESEARKLLKQEPPNILITNPDSLHYAMLAYSEHWINFFRSLRFVVLDEAHEYRGYFGTNVAYVVRRLLALCRSLGADPQIVVSSATIANPEEHARALTGREMRVVRAEKAGRCKKHMVFINPDYRDFQYENLLMHKLSLLTTACVENKVAALIFCPTRRFVERVHKRASRELERKGLDSATIAPYKSGYTPDERREIERDLKSGKLLVVFSTNALEIGIDMGRLDMIVMVGFPDTVMSAWQRAGRAGRSLDAEALVIFFASRNPIDQFYVRNIDLFMNKPLDRLAVNLANEEVLKPHALCALFEHGGERGYLTAGVLGPSLAETCANLTPDLGLMKIARPHRSVNLRSILGQTYIIKSKDDKEIGTISGDKLFTEVYIGAIYDHYGRSWRVVSHGASDIYVEPNTVEHYTKPTRFSSIPPAGRFEGGKRWHGDQLEATLLLGRVEVTDTLAGYKEYDERSGELVDSVSYQAASVNKYRTDSCWLQLNFQDASSAERRFLQLHSLEHGLRATIPLGIPCDPYDFAGLSKKVGLGGLPTMILYDTVKGGIGIAEEIFRAFPEFLQSSIQLLGKCRCESSCPRCIQIPRCPEYNEQLDRGAGLELANRLISLFASLPESLRPETMEWLSQEPPERV